MRVLITGSNGLLGQKLAKTFSLNHQTTGIDLQTEPFIKTPNFSYQNINITEKDKLEELFASFKPDAVINAGAYTDVDGCESNKEKAWEVNVGGVKNISRLCRGNKARLVQLSTDYIFDGKAGPYSEEDTPNPKGYYGVTKLESEKVILDSKIDFLIVRTNVLYGKSLGETHDFVLWLIRKLKNRQEVKIVTDQYSNPTLADNLAEAIKEATEKNISGVLNIAGGKKVISRYDFALKIAEKFNLDQSLIKKVLTSELNLPAPRPLKGGLKIDKAKSLLKTELLDVEKGLEYLKKKPL
ncbi:MAG: dTDP-4-dehydrorhamnose reductase [candidate division Zixibacteria bacterium RBG_16_43_9]|nr:MAG: dTDP-4-dehydrorhamnose reductase [candidate division Zixibacteria bacterium RBG_16_43_9]